MSHPVVSTHEQGLRMLTTLSDLVSQETTELGLLQAAAPLLMDFANADHVGFVRAHELSGETFLVAEYPPTPMIGARLPRERSLTATIRRTRSELLIDDVATHPQIGDELRAILLGVGARSMALLPMLDAQGRLFASVGFDYKAPHTLPDKTCMMYLRLAINQLSAVLLRIRLQAQYQRQAEQLQKINAFSRRIAPSIPLADALRLVLDAAQTLEPFDYVALYLLPTGHERLERVALYCAGAMTITPDGVTVDDVGYTPYHQTFMEGQPTFVQDLLADLGWQHPTAVGVRTLAVYPLARQGGPFGVLELGSRDPYAYDSPTLSVFQQFTNEVALLISSVQSYWQAQQETALKLRAAEITSTLQQQTEMEALLQTTLQALTSAFGGQRARIRLGPAQETKG